MHRFSAAAAPQIAAEAYKVWIVRLLGMRRQFPRFKLAAGKIGLGCCRKPRLGTEPNN
jgi:hypothetical protein